jgi:prepilin-type N-terminal cleavage/methylation domain-containing protein
MGFEKLVNCRLRIADCGIPSPTLPPRKLCRKSVHGSTGSPRTDYGVLKINYLAVRPEPVEGRNVNYDTISRGGGRGGGELRAPNSNGVTLIESIMVIGIIAILSVVVIPKLDFGLTSSRASVDGAAYMIASDIRYAQEFAMANRVSKSVTFTSGSSVYTFSPTSGLDQTGRLPSGATIGSNLTITFNSLGEPTSGGGGSVTVSGGGQTRTISVVNYTGKVNIS